MADKTKKRRIAINALSAKVGGGVTFLRNMVPGLLDQDTKNDYFLIISDSGCGQIFKGLELNPRLKFIRINPGNSLLRLLTEQFILPLLLLKHRIDILYCPANIISFFAPCKKILWIQNIDPFVNVKGNSFLRGMRIRLLGWLTYLSMRAASIVVFSSDFSRRHVLEMTKIAPRKARRIYLGVDTERRDLVTNRVSTKKYILSVSNLYLHKNYEVLIKAYGRLDKSLQEKYDLIIIGGLPEKSSLGYLRYLEDICRIMGISRNVKFLQDIKNNEVHRIFNGASIFVMPSLVESFSFPVFEAMAAGLPVLVANAACLPEAVGEAGIVFDPHDPSDLAQKMSLVLRDEGLCREFSREALKRVQSFKWERTVSETLKAFAEVKPG